MSTSNSDVIALGFCKQASGDAMAYKAYFNKKMKEWNINSPSDIKSKSDKKKFYDEVDKGYQTDSE